MRNKLLTLVALSSFCAAGLQAQLPESYQWIVRAPDGPFTLSVPSVTIPTTGTQYFNITMSDWDKFEDPQNLGTFASMGSISGQLTILAPTTLPTGITLNFDSVVSASESTHVVKYKFTTSNAAASAFTILWKLEDLGGWDMWDNQVGKDSDQSCLQSIGF
jgi:hypothetical protein